MANTLTGLIPVIYDALNIVSRELVGFIPAVSRDSKTAMAAKGQIVRSPVVGGATSYDIEPSITNPDNGDAEIGYVDMTIQKSKYSPVRWSGEEQMSVKGEFRQIAVQQFAQAMRVHVNEIEDDLGGLFTGASRAYGTAGSTPFATAGDMSDFAQPMKILQDNGAPMGDIHMVLGTTASANIRGKQSQLFKVNEAGTDELLRQGALSQIQKFFIHESAGVQYHTKGTGAAYAVNDVGNYVAGDSTITIDTGTGTVIAGDAVTYAGDLNKYIVNTGATGAGDIVIAQPGLLAALANDTAMTIGGSYTANMFFAKSAIQLATRMPAMPVDENGKSIDSAEDVITVTDPISGLSFQVAMYRERRRIRYEVGIAWGVKNVKAEHTGILLG